MQTEHARPKHRMQQSVETHKPDFTPIDHKMADFERRQYER